jgi:hypothetical protein
MQLTLTIDPCRELLSVFSPVKYGRRDGDTEEELNDDIDQ